MKALKISYLILIGLGLLLPSAARISGQEDQSYVAVQTATLFKDDFEDGQISDEWVITGTLPEVVTEEDGVLKVRPRNPSPKDQGLIYYKVPLPSDKRWKIRVKKKSWGGYIWYGRSFLIVAQPETPIKWTTKGPYVISFHDHNYHGSFIRWWDSNGDLHKPGREANNAEEWKNKVMIGILESDGEQWTATIKYPDGTIDQKITKNWNETMDTGRDYYLYLIGQVPYGYEVQKRDYYEVSIQGYTPPEKEGPAEGYGIGALGEKLPLNTYYQKGVYELRDVTHDGEIKTYNYPFASFDDFRLCVSLGAACWGQKIATDKDKHWIEENQAAEVSAHYNVGRVYEYFQGVHGRDSFDGSGSPISVYTHVKGFGAEEKWPGWWEWLEPEGILAFGSIAQAPYSGALDVVGHEFTHAVVRTAIGKMDEKQPGALNESIADVFGTLIEFYYEGESGDWKIGEDVGPWLRDLETSVSMSDYKPGDVHFNSRIISHAFYLGVEYLGGGAKARHEMGSIWYEAVINYLDEKANFQRARQAFLKAAEYLYGKESEEYKAVNEGFLKVGIGPKLEVSLSISPKREQLWQGTHESYNPGDSAYIVRAKVTSGGEPVTGASVKAQITAPNDKAYWFRDGTLKLHDVIRAEGRDENGLVVGPTFGGTKNDGVYANFLEIGGNFGVGTWRIKVTARKGNREASAVLTKEIGYSCGKDRWGTKARANGYPCDFGHWMKSIDLDSSTPEEDWMVHATPGETFQGEIVYDETRHCGGCCAFYMRAWGKPYENWGDHWDIDQGCTGWRKDVIKTWRWKAPSESGTYVLSLADVFAYWWPYYSNGEFFTGKVIVE